MESQNVPDVLGVTGKKRRANGWDYRRMRQENAETQLHEQEGENVVLERLLEEHKHKRSVEELTEQLRTTKVSFEEQKSNVQQLAYKRGEQQKFASNAAGGR
jgi:hypothetical protein